MIDRVLFWLGFALLAGAFLGQPGLADPAKGVSSPVTRPAPEICYRPVEHGQRPPMRFSSPEDDSIENKPHNFIFFNISSMKCEGFYFRGSRSNGNIFRSVEECQEVCGNAKVTSQPALDSASTTSPPAVDSGVSSPVTRPAPEICYRPVEHGQRPPMRFSPPEDDSIENKPHNFIFFNISSMKCEGFYFRGSASNGNIFVSVEECQEVCGNAKVTSQPALDSASTTSPPAVDSGVSSPVTRPAPEICYRPVEHGARPPVRFSPPEDDSIENKPHNFIFFNISSMKCEGFYFRGSLSNGNIFRSVEECQEVCGNAKVTSQPALDSASTTSPPAVDSGVSSPVTSSAPEFGECVCYPPEDPDEY